MPESSDYAVIKLAWEPPNTHRAVRIFAGSDRDHLALCGRVVFTPDEAERFRSTVRMGIQQPGFTGVLESGWVNDGR